MRKLKSIVQAGGLDFSSKPLQAWPKTDLFDRDFSSKCQCDKVDEEVLEINGIISRARDVVGDLFQRGLL